MILTTTLAVFGVGTPIITGLIAFWGGRKSSATKKKDEFDAYKLEAESFKSFRDLLIADNNSLIAEVKELQKEMSLLKLQLKELINSNCPNYPTCIHR